MRPCVRRHIGSAASAPTPSGQIPSRGMLLRVWNRRLDMKQSACLWAAVLGVSLLSGCSKDCSIPADGCPCDPLKDAPFCAAGGGPSVGFSCEGGQWITGPDGPCMPTWDGGHAKDTPAVSETRADTPSVADGGGGACAWPASLTASGDGSAVGCWAHAVSGPVDASQITCSSAEYALTCVGDWPPADGGLSTPVHIPDPDASLACRILPVPTPMSALFYCCPCNHSQ
jgi:hypothetical protein